MNPVRPELVEGPYFLSTVDKKNSPSTSSGQTVVFSERAAKLAGLSGALFGWSPDIFWNATPVELASVVAALAGNAAPLPPARDEIAALMEAFPDG